MFYPDLGTICQVDQGPHVRAIGWLHPDHLFPTGVVPSEFLTALRNHAISPWLPVLSAGPHFCEFCPPRKRGEPYIGGSRNLWIPSTSVVYVAPEMIIHYIDSHSYQPPEEFITAVLSCPPQNSEAFLEMLRVLGYGDLVDL
ncbi:MAG: hypothetical protein ACRC8S_20920 [Fimbriiglobus sp.]